MIKKIRKDDIWWCDNGLLFNTDFTSALRNGFFVLTTYKEVKSGKLTLSLKKGKRRVLVSGEVVHHRDYHRDGISDYTFFLTNKKDKLRGLLK